MNPLWKLSFRKLYKRKCITIDNIIGNHPHGILSLKYNVNIIGLADRKLDNVYLTVYLRMYSLKTCLKYCVIEMENISISKSELLIYLSNSSNFAALT